jgi:hypothetical protein
VFLGHDPVSSGEFEEAEFRLALGSRLRVEPFWIGDIARARASSKCIGLRSITFRGAYTII